MASLWLWVLVGVALYTVIAMGLKAAGRVPEYVSITGPMTTIHTQRGKAVLDRLARRERFWRAWGNLGVGVALVVVVLSGVVVGFTLWAILTQPETNTIESPQQVLVIPGVNEYLPLAAAGEIIFGLLVGLVVHEGGHGLLCRVENIDIDSMGVATLAFIPMGAFVQPDAEEQMEANRGAQIRMFAAGVTNNFAVTALALLLLVGPVLGSIAVVPGAAVGNAFDGSGAQEAGIEQGDIITGIDGTAVENGSELEDVLDETDNERVTVSLDSGENLTVERRLTIIGSVEGLIDDIEGRDPLTRIRAIDGQAVHTEQDLERVTADDPVVTLETERRGNATIPVGASIASVEDDGPFARAGAPADGTPIIVTAVAGERVVDAESFRDALDARDGPFSIEAYVGENPASGQVETFTVTPDDSDEIGVLAHDGYSGILVDDFGVDPYPSEQFFEMLSGPALDENLPAAAGAFVYLVQIIILPFMGLLNPDVAFSFAGFVPDVTSFYAVEGSLGFMGGSLFTVANLLFWTAWINFNLAVFNCIPAFPLDGGHLLRVSTESVTSRLPVGGRPLVTVVTVGITLAMIASLVMMVFGSVIL